MCINMYGFTYMYVCTLHALCDVNIITTTYMFLVMVMNTFCNYVCVYKLCHAKTNNATITQISKRSCNRIALCRSCLADTELWRVVASPQRKPMHNIYRLEPSLNKIIGDDKFSIDFCFGLQAQRTDRTDAKINMFHTVCKWRWFISSLTLSASWCWCNLHVLNSAGFSWTFAILRLLNFLVLLSPLFSHRIIHIIPKFRRPVLNCIDADCSAIRHYKEIDHMKLRCI